MSVARPRLCLLAFLLGAALPATAVATGDPFTIADIEDRLGTAVPLDLTLEDAEGHPVRLGDRIGRRPAMLVPVDLDCQNICGITLAGLFEALDDLEKRPGEDYELLVVSIDPETRPIDALAARADYRARFASAGGASFLTGDARPLLDAIGFRFAYDPETDQYAHPTAVAVVNVEGRLANWLYGYPFEAFDLRLALDEAGGGGIGGLSDRLWQLCFRYDPKIGAYTPAILGALKIGGVLTVLLIGGGIALMLRHDRGPRG